MKYMSTIEIVTERNGSGNDVAIVHVSTGTRTYRRENIDQQPWREERKSYIKMKR